LHALVAVFTEMQLGLVVLALEFVAGRLTLRRWCVNCSRERLHARRSEAR
jgi:hypothetical protein